MQTECNVSGNVKKLRWLQRKKEVFREKKVEDHFGMTLKKKSNTSWINIGKHPYSHMIFLNFEFLTSSLVLVSLY